MRKKTISLLVVFALLCSITLPVHTAADQQWRHLHLLLLRTDHLYPALFSF